MFYWTVIAVSRGHLQISDPYHCWSTRSIAINKYNCKTNFDCLVGNDLRLPFPDGLRSTAMSMRTVSCKCCFCVQKNKGARLVSCCAINWQCICGSYAYYVRGYGKAVHQHCYCYVAAALRRSQRMDRLRQALAFIRRPRANWTKSSVEQFSKRKVRGLFTSRT